MSKCEGNYVIDGPIYMVRGVRTDEKGHPLTNEEVAYADWHGTAYHWCKKFGKEKVMADVESHCK